MNIGEKINLYKERLGFRYLKEMADVAGVTGTWLNELSKKDELKVTDIPSLIKLSRYLGVSIEQLVSNDGLELQDNCTTEFKYIDNNCDDIGELINEMKFLLDKEDLKLDGILLNKKARQICKDSLNVIKLLAKQCI